MNRNDMLVLHITNDYKVSVETMENGVSSVKYISAESILDCLKSSIHNDGRIDSGILPQNCISYSGCANGNEFVVISFEEKTTDIIFEKTEYKDFPIPRLVFGFLVSGDGRIINVRLGVTEKGRLTPNQKCLFIRFRMLADFIFVREVMYYRKSNHYINLADCRIIF